MALNKADRSARIEIERMTCARIPTDVGEFQLCHFRNNLDDKEHLALVSGDVHDKDNVLVRVHSECFTGDVLGSLRCDCGPQLQRSLELIAAERCGVIVYLRQEGRNIGLLDKLRAYNLQDDGYDTVDANLMLGHQADSRDYVVAALILQNLGVSSIRLLTNNPRKIEDIRDCGIEVTARLALQEGVNEENHRYLTTKARRMRHMLDLELLGKSLNGGPADRPYVTLSYAQSLDGSIAARRGEPYLLSGPEAMAMTHRLRADHDAILVGIGTVLADDPRLSVRLVEGPDPIPVILDSHLRTPPTAALLGNSKSPWIITSANASRANEDRLLQAGARVIRLPQKDAGLVDLDAMLRFLYAQGVRRLMVEGGASVISAFLTGALVDRVVITIAPTFLGGLTAVQQAGSLTENGLPRLRNAQYRQLGQDMIVVGEIDSSK